MDRTTGRLAQQFSQLSVQPFQDELSKRRNWHSVDVQGAVGGSRGNRLRGQEGLFFTVASYNILSQYLLEQHSDLYEHLDPKFLTWNYRKQKLIDEIHSYQPDILCLQEVEYLHFKDFFRHELESKGYKGVYKQRTGGKTDGCATFYKQNKFIYEKHADVEFSRPDLGLDRDNIGLLVLLRARNEAQYAGKLCVANTHLLYNPRRGDIKLAQLMLLLAKIDEVATISENSRNHQYHPMILCGDLNLEPFSDLHLFLCRGFLQYGSLMQHEMSGQVSQYDGRCFPMTNFLGRQHAMTQTCQFSDVLWKRFGIDHSTDFSGFITHGLNLISVYPHYSQVGLYSRKVKEATCIQHDRPATVDYIFYSATSRKTRFRNDQLQLENVREGSLRLIQILKLPSEQDFQDLGKLPTKNLASDHLILLAEFQLHN